MVVSLKLIALPVPWIAGAVGVRVSHGPFKLVARWTAKPLSLTDWSTQVTRTLWLLPLPESTAVTLAGGAGATARAAGRIMSISSCARMWQCQTYSQPKLVISLTTVTGLLPVSILAKPGALFALLAPMGSVTSNGRTLLGRLQGRFCFIGFKATMMSSNGFIRTVSFQDTSLSSGGL